MIVRYLSTVLFAVMLMGITGCATTSGTAQVDNNAGAQPLPPYSGPKVRVAVADFDVKAAKAVGQIGPGLREMLITALVNSNRFSVFDRQALSAVMLEQELSAASAVQSDTGAKKGYIKTADIVITAAATEFEPHASGSRASIGAGGGVGSSILGGLLSATSNKAHMALDIRIIDTTTSEVLAATRVQGQASDISGDLSGTYTGGFKTLTGGLSSYANTPMEKAIRNCIIEAVRYIAQATPGSYYK